MNQKLLSPQGLFVECSYQFGGISVYSIARACQIGWNLPATHLPVAMWHLLVG
jgi:hypothetical protein